MAKNISSSNKKGSKLTKKTIKNTNTPSRLKRFLNHPLAIPASLLLVFGIYMVLGWYTPRPLAKDFTYVGRDYDSGCIVPFVWSFLCMASGHENYFYTTDVPPEEFANRFEGWKTRNINYKSASVNSAAVVYLENEYTAQDGLDFTNTSVEYLKDQEQVRRDNLLMPVNKKYLVEIWPGAREEIIGR